MLRLLLILPVLIAVSAAGQTSRKLVRLPFEQLTGGVIVLKAFFEQRPDTLNFILDSGSGGISLDSTTAEAFKMIPSQSSNMIRGIAGVRRIRYLTKKSLNLQGLKVDSLDFHVNDYSLLDAVYGMHIDGIIGYSVFSRYILHINYDSAFVEFWSRGSVKYPKGGLMLRPIITSLPIQPATVTDQTQHNARFLYDLGAGLNLLLSERFVKDSNLLQPKRKFYLKEAEGLGGKIDMKVTVIRKFRLGPYRFSNVPVYVFDDVNNITSYPYLGGLIGSDLLRRFNSIINYEQREFYLTPNSHFRDGFDYAYSGVELYYLNGQILVGDVAEGSPAEKSGLLEGDLVVGVNNVFNQNLTQFKAALQVANSKVKLIVVRDGEYIQIQFKVGSIR